MDFDLSYYLRVVLEEKRAFEESFIKAETAARVEEVLLSVEAKSSILQRVLDFISDDKGKCSGS